MCYMQFSKMIKDSNEKLEQDHILEPFLYDSYSNSLIAQDIKLLLDHSKGLSKFIWSILSVP